MDESYAHVLQKFQHTKQGHHEHNNLKCHSRFLFERAIMICMQIMLMYVSIMYDTCKKMANVRKTFY